MIPPALASLPRDACDAILDGRDAVLDALDRGGAPFARRLALAALAGAAVLGVLALLQGTADRPVAEQPAAEPSAPAADGAAPVSAPDSGTAAAPAGEDEEAEFVRRDSWSLLLPAGWTAVDPAGPEAFRAEAEGGEALLWVEREPDLSPRQFVERSLAELRELDPRARVSHQAGTPDTRSWVVQLRAALPGAGGADAPYVVTLRANGPLRYYLATSLASDASPAVRDGAARIHGSLTPETG